MALDILSTNFKRLNKTQCQH